MQARDWLTTLKNLRAEIAQAEQLDLPTKEQLQSLAQDIQRLVESEPGPSREHTVSVSDRVREAVLRFETHHPRLTALLNQIGDGLANLGI